MKVFETYSSRQFNNQHEICGALYYADGSFFQCLEGEDNAVKNLYANIIKDSRHNTITLLKVSPIKDSTFKSWIMKYVVPSSPVKSLFNKFNFDNFLPAQLTHQQLDQLLDILYIESKKKY